MYNMARLWLERDDYNDNLTITIRDFFPMRVCQPQTYLILKDVSPTYLNGECSPTTTVGNPAYLVFGHFGSLGQDPTSLRQDPN